MYMSHLINRISEKTVEKYLEIFPCVVILGSRQCGKSTLMRMFGESHSLREHVQVIGLEELVRKLEVFS